MKIGDYDTHPIADAFPLLQGEEYERFRDDIERDGVRDRDVPLYEGKLLDARNRYRACIDLGPAFVRKLKFVAFDGDPFAYVISRNIISRRHLNESQRAIVACRLATMKPGRPKKDRRSAEISTEQAAAALNVGERTVARAKAVLKSADKDVIAAVERGELSLEQAATQQRPRKEPETRSQDYDDDPIKAMRAVIMRAAHDAGALVRTRQNTDGCVLEVGYRGQGVIITLERIEAS